MADIRIKDLTTTASSTASDDFIAVDGTTNGTRKLNAFSPTFGGNATVTGTLTANGTITANSSTNAIVVNGAGITMDTDPAGSSASLRFVDGATPRFWIYKLSGDSNLYFRDMTNGRMQLQMLPGATSSNAISTFNSILSVTSTTASTSTSSGALVVSGGVGVGGAINASGNATVGGTLTVSGSSSKLTVSNSTANSLLADFASAYAGGAASPYLVVGSYSDPSTSGARIVVDTDYSNNFQAAMRLQTRNASGTLQNALTLAITRNATFAADVAISGTTASTTTSSGALVVSGGVGVAGAIVTGGIIRCGGSNGLSLGSDTGNIRIDSAGPAGVEFRGLSAADTITGFTMREMALIDGTTAPSTRAGYATIYVDTADGDLKVKFGDGTVKTIATDS